FDRCALRTVADAILANFGFALLVIGFVANRIPAGIAVLVDVAVVGHPVPDLAAGLVMPRLGGADEIIVGSVEQLGHLAELVGIPLRKCGRFDAFRPRRLLHLLTVFVSTRQEEDVLTVETLETRHGIRRDQLIGMADMRLAV